MGDRELLELAAKSAGIKLAFNGYGKVPEEGSVARFIGEEIYFFSTRPGQGNVLWSPLEDDGDALHLAVKRGIKFKYHSELGQGLAWDTLGNEYQVNVEDCRCSPNAAARRAIVLAAVGAWRAKP